MKEEDGPDTVPATGDRSAARDRLRPLKVVVSADERARIVALARQTGLTVSSYLRTVGLGTEPRSMLDQDAVKDLARIAADQGRLGGLLKLWLSSRPGEGATPAEVRAVLHQVEALQAKLWDVAERL